MAEADRGEPSRFSAWLAMVMVYILLAPGIAALLINAYEVGVNGQPFSGRSIIAFYMFGWVFALAAAVIHTFTLGWKPVLSLLATVLPLALLLMLLEEKMGIVAVATLTICFWIAAWLGRRLQSFSSR